MSSIKDELSYIREKIDKILITTSKNEEHLRNLNGAIKRHEDSIALNSRRINKLYYFLGVACGIVSVILFIVQIVL